MATGTEYNAKLKIWTGPEYKSSDPNISFGEILLARLEVHGDKIMQVNHNTGYKMSAREMRLKALKVADSLSALGVKPGDHIQISLNEHDDLVSLWLGILVSGAVLNTLHTSFSEHEMSHFIRLVEPKMIICEEDIIDTVRKGLLGAEHKASVWTFTQTNDVEVRSVGELVDGFDQEFTFTPPNLGDLSEALAIIMCTSGTTSMPKAVRISHAMAKYGLFKQWPSEDGLVLFSASQLYWISCLSTIIMSITLRMVRVITEDPLTPEHVLDVVEKHKANVLFMTTNRLVPIMECLKKRSYDLTALKMVQTSGSLLSLRTREAFKELFRGITMYIYGMTDPACGIAISYSMSKVYSTGRLMPGVQIKVIDESGQAVSHMETGELCLKTPTPILGYLKSDRKTNGVFSEDDWFYTGDLGYFDTDNELFLVDRKKDMIKYQCYQISPSDLEQLIEKHIDVESIVVVGIPDPMADGMHLPAALVVKNDRNPSVTEEEITKLVEDNMMDSKRLRGGVYFVKSLPTTITGKFQRNKALLIAIELYNKNHISV